MASQTQHKSDWTVIKLLTWTTEYLANADVDQARLCAEILLGHVLQCHRIDLYVQFEHRPTPPQLTQFRQLLQRCAQHEPTAYLTGTAHFYSLELKVSPAVLIPRPETELLVTQAVDFLRHQTNRPHLQTLDMCTGSGCVAIAIAANVIETEIIALDRSAAALEIAQANIDQHDLQSRVTLLQSDLFENIHQAPADIFDLVVANPPYISTAEFETLDPMVSQYEPQEALLAGPDGLAVHRRLLDQAEDHLADAGALMVEVAYNQAQQVIALFQQSGYLTDISAVKDNLGHQRVVKARKK